MGSYLNPGNFSFRGSLRSKIYVDKSELIARTNEALSTRTVFLIRQRLIFVIADHADSESRMQQICWQHIMTEVSLQRNCLRILRLAKTNLTKKI